MPKYLWRTSYTQAGAKGVGSEGGSGRRDAAKTAVESVGGTLDAFYFAFGGADAYVMPTCPTTRQHWRSRSPSTDPAARPSRPSRSSSRRPVDAATKREVSFRPPGG